VVPDAPAPGAEPAPDRFTHLLELQDHDTAVDQLRHRRSSLPERGQLSGVEERIATIDKDAGEVQVQRDELGARQANLEEQIEASKRRRSELEKRMFGGQVTAARDLQAMDEEVRHLHRHISDLEDRELEVMEALEPLDAELGAAATERGTLDGRAGELHAAIAALESELDAEIATQVDARTAAAQTIPAELLATYERLRAKLGGTGAARLVGNSCGGCHLTLPAMEVDRIRKAAPDAVITCDQCGRILVR
jgi:predicted  nucleic acid-binding Zn-ribbon protein